MAEKVRKIRMLKSTHGSTNGLDRHHFERASEHEVGTPLMPEHLAQAFLDGGDAEEIGHEDAAGQGKQAEGYDGGDYTAPPLSGTGKKPGPSERKA